MSEDSKSIGVGNFGRGERNIGEGSGATLV